MGIITITQGDIVILALKLNLQFEWIASDRLSLQNWFSSLKLQLLNMNIQI